MPFSQFSLDVIMDRMSSGLYFISQYVDFRVFQDIDWTINIEFLVHFLRRLKFSVLLIEIRFFPSNY